MQSTAHLQVQVKQSGIQSTTALHSIPALAGASSSMLSSGEAHPPSEASLSSEAESDS